MSSVGVPNNVCSSLRTPSGNPLMDVEIWNRSSFTWARRASDTATGGGAAWQAATAGQKPTPIAQKRSVRCTVFACPVLRAWSFVLGQSLVVGPWTVLGSWARDAVATKDKGPRTA